MCFTVSTLSTKKPMGNVFGYVAAMVMPARGPRSPAVVRADRQIQREHQHERASTARRALDGDVSPEEVRQTPRDVQAQPGATHAPRGLLLHLPERVENPLDVLWGDTDTGVTHFEDHRAAVLP